MSELPINQIIQGDCLDVMKDWPDGCVDGIVCDWPYSTGTRKEGQKGLRKSMCREVDDTAWFELDSLTTNGFIWFARSVSWEGARLVKEGSHSLWFIDWRMYPIASGAIETSCWRVNNLVVWDKAMIGMGSCFRNQHELIIHASRGMGREPSRRDVPNVLRFPAIRNGLHPTQKPIDLMCELISVISEPGDTILDPCCGVGATCVAAKSLGRNYTGIDISEEYCDIARKRLEAVDTGVPVKERDNGQIPLFGAK